MLCVRDLVWSSHGLVTKQGPSSLAEATRSTQTHSWWQHRAWCPSFKLLSPRVSWCGSGGTSYNRCPLASAKPVPFLVPVSVTARLPPSLPLGRVLLDLQGLRCSLCLLLAPPRCLTTRMSCLPRQSPWHCSSSTVTLQMKSLGLPFCASPALAVHLGCCSGNLPPGGCGPPLSPCLWLIAELSPSAAETSDWPAFSSELGRCEQA